MASADNVRGATFMVASCLAFTANDTLIKGVSGSLPLFQAILIRGIVATLLIAVIARAAGQLRLPASRQDRRLVALRCLGEAGGTLGFLTALFHMPIANASAILQSVPLVITLAAALVFGETVGWRRYVAIAIGFCGVLIIVRPGAEGFNAYALWALASVGFITLRDLSTRRMSPGVPVLGLVVATSLATTTLGAVGLAIEGWVPVRPAEVLELCAAAVCLLGGYFFGVNAMRLGEIGAVQPFRYSLLLWAIFFGILVFGEWPDAWMIAGSAIIVGTGLYTLHRERRSLREAILARR